MQPQYPGGGYWVPPPPRLHGGENNTFGLLAMIFGILAIPLALCQFPMGFGFPLAAAFGVAGVVLGILGIRRADRGLANAAAWRSPEWSAARSDQCSRSLSSPSSSSSTTSAGTESWAFSV